MMNSKTHAHETHIITIHPADARAEGARRAPPQPCGQRVVRQDGTRLTPTHDHMLPPTLNAMNSTRCFDTDDATIAATAALHGMTIGSCASAARQGFCRVAAGTCPLSCGACHVARASRSLQKSRASPPSPAST
eukprot:7129029-Prymnesium_polylepis.1